MSDIDDVDNTLVSKNKIQSAWKLARISMIVTGLAIVIFGVLVIINKLEVWLYGMMMSFGGPLFLVSTVIWWLLKEHPYSQSSPDNTTDETGTKTEDEENDTPNNTTGTQETSDEISTITKQNDDEKTQNSNPFNEP